MIKPYKADIKQLLAFTTEAMTAHQTWRGDSWEDWEFRDGLHWKASARQQLINKGINPITVNRTFPIINLVNGHFIQNQQDMVAKGRTRADNELGQVMSEGLKFVSDQNRGPQRTISAFQDQIITGFGCMNVGYSHDPRTEKVRIGSNPWYSIWWDPYGSPWMQTENTRYVFSAEWKDLQDICALMPNKRQEIMDKFADLSSDYYIPDVYDQGTFVEEYHQNLASNTWVNSERKRIRPIEMWYTHLEKDWFAKLPNGRVIELSKAGDENAQYALIQQASEVVSAVVKKMRVATFISDLILQDLPSPYPFDGYPFVPFIGYLDRFGYPFGIPRQIKEQNMEVDKRRSMALNLISNRRVILEAGAAEDMGKAYTEFNRSDGFVVLKPGKMGAYKIEELAALAPSQMNMLEQSETEMKEISGENDEALGYKSPIQSGKALAVKQQTTAAITASLIKNAHFSQQMMGEKLAALIQDSWTDEKVLRITDRVTGVEKFIEVNKPVQTLDGVIEITNNISQGMFDIVIATKPMTDTMREKNMELLFAAINKSPADVVGPLLNLALEISDIPEKDILLRQIREATGVGYIDDTLTSEERKAQEQQAQKEKQAQEQQNQQLTLKDRLIKQKLDEAKAEKTQAEAAKIRSEIGTADKGQDNKSYELGQKMGLQLLQGGKHG